MDAGRRRHHVHKSVRSSPRITVLERLCAHQRGRPSCSLDSVFSTFFRYGQVIETFRGNGIFQPAIDDAIQKLNSGEWVCVCQMF